MRINGELLVNQLVAGAGCAAMSLPVAGPVLPVVALAYVTVASMFFARVYASADLTPGREARAWLLAWLAAAGLWAVVLDPPVGGPEALAVGAVIATPCYLAWQVAALAVAQLRGNVFLAVTSRNSPRTRRT